MKKYFQHTETKEIYFEGKDQKNRLNLINAKTSSEYFLPGYYGEETYFPFKQISERHAKTLLNDETIS